MAKSVDKQKYSSKWKIPFNKSSLAGNEFEYIKASIDSGHISGDGIYTQKCHDFLENKLHFPKALLTTSCTHALEIAALVLDIKLGDEVIVPSYTFVSTINAFAIHGAKPVFADIRPDTLNIDETQIRKLITSKTRAIIPVHYAGVACEMDALTEVAHEYDLSIIEDNAHGLFAKYKNKDLGTFGAMSTLSFHETKNFSCGEGGALLINDLDLIEAAEIIREKGTDRSKFFRGEVDKYSWVSLGSSYLPSDILAAFLLAQLEKYKDIQSRRKRIWHYYYDNTSDWAESNNIRLPVVPKHCEQSYHMFYILLPSCQKRQELIEHLKNKGILSVFHYLPLHLSKMGRKFGGTENSCPVTEDVSNRILRLPFFNTLTQQEQDMVLTELKSFTF